MILRGSGLLAILLPIFGGCILAPQSYQGKDEEIYQRATGFYDSAATTLDSARSSVDTSRAQTLFDSAAVAFRLLIADYPWSDRKDNSQYYLGKSLLGLHACTARSGYLDEAYSSLSEIDSRSTYYANAMYWRGTIRYRQQRWAEALALFDEYLGTYIDGDHRPSATTYRVACAAQLGVTP